MKPRTLVTLVTLLFVALVSGALYGCPKYRIYRLEMRGRATLKEAEFTRKVQIEDAKAKALAAEFNAKAAITKATYDAQSDTVRARGVALSNEIIGASLKGNEEYLRWLWINKAIEGSTQLIYVPTETQLPILEAGKR